MEPENLDPMPRNIFLLEPRIRSPYELGLLCLSLLWSERLQRRNDDKKDLKFAKCTESFGIMRVLKRLKSYFLYGRSKVINKLWRSWVNTIDRKGHWRRIYILTKTHSLMTSLLKLLQNPRLI